jgi:hypothetical protein
MRYSLSILIALFLAGIARSENGYVVRIDPKRPNIAHLSLTISPSAVSRSLFERGAQWGVQSQIRVPRCASIPLKQTGRGKWVIPKGCGHITWQIKLSAPRSTGADASLQQSLYFSNGPWWLIADATALLRIEGSDEWSTLVLILKTSRSRIAGNRVGGLALKSVPPLSKAPEFYVLGAMPATTKQIGPVHVEYVSDDAARIAQSGLIEMHAATLRYLSSIVPLPLTPATPHASLLVIWLGIHADIGEAGGAAGHRSFVANYIYGPQQNQQLNAARTLMVLAHEQFHQLVDLAREQRAPLTTWVNESLAQYYALKAIDNSDVDSPTKEVIFNRYVDPNRRIETGLTELARRHAKGDSSVYPRFYEQGATFWSLLDRALREASEDRQSLDSFVPTLLRDDTASGEQLPTSLLNAMRTVAGARIDTIVEMYLGQ